jgi:predicted SPOUT superfamily RNA methylase MTH1
MSPSLKYAGLLPPLRTRSHPLATNASKIHDGEVRWGIQIRPGFVDIGLDDPIEYEGKLRTRVPTLFRITRNENRLVLEPIDRESLPFYFGYDVEMIPDLVPYLHSKATYTRIALSRLGVQFQSIAPEIESTLENTRSIIAVFGGPQSGVRDLVQDKDGLKQNIDYWINTIPDQGTETVRLEEAVWISLGQFNTFFGKLVAKNGYYEK